MKKKVIILFISRICEITYQRRTKLFEFPRDTNRVEFTIRNINTLKWLHFEKVSFCNDTILLYNGCITLNQAVCEYSTNKDVYFPFRCSRWPIFTTMLSSYLTRGSTGKYWPFGKDFLDNEKALAVWTFS